MRFKATAITATNYGTGIVLNIGLPVTYGKQIDGIIQGFKAGNEYELNPYKAKRSLSANAYFWVLADKIAYALKSTKEEVYQSLIRRVGVFVEVTFPVNGTDEEAEKKATEAMNKFKSIWQHNGTGWLTQTLDKEKRIVRAYKGSSQYKTDEMSRLIEEAISEAKSLGIETKPQWEVDAMLNEWGNK